MARDRRGREEEKRRSRYHLDMLNIGRAVLLGVAVAVAGAALGEAALSVVGALVAIAALARGVVLRRRDRSRR